MGLAPGDLSRTLTGSLPWSLPGWGCPVPVEALCAPLPKQPEPLPERSRVPFGDQEIQPESEHLEHSDPSHTGLGQEVTTVAVGVVALDLVGGVLGVEVPAEHRLELR